MEELYRRNWTAADAKGAVVLIHGQGEHSGRYEYAAAYLTSRGYHVYSGDLPGHGRSGGIRGHVDSFEEYLELVDQWVRNAREAHPSLPIFILGHSVGGLIAIRYAQVHTPALSGMVLTGPALRIKYKVPAWKTALGRWLDRAAPRLCMPSGLKTQRVTRNPEVLEAMAADTQMIYVASVRFYNELLRAQEDAFRNASRFSLRVLLMHGEADEIIDPSASLAFSRQLSSADREAVLLPGLHHEILNEPERDMMLGRITDWLDARLGP